MEGLDRWEGCVDARSWIDTQLHYISEASLLILGLEDIHTSTEYTTSRVYNSTNKGSGFYHDA